MKDLLTLSDIQRIKELYIHTFFKHKAFIDDMVEFQNRYLKIPCTVRRFDPLEAPYDVNGEEYNVESPICGTWEYAFILNHLPLRPGVTVLDAASSASPFPCYLTHLGYEVIAVDLDISYQERIKHAAGFQYRTLKADLKDIPLANGSVDVIISNSSLEHIPDDVPMWREFTRVLRDDGLMIHTIPTAKPSDYRNAWLDEPLDFFANPTPEHDRTHRLVNKRIAEAKYFEPNDLWCEIWEEHFCHRSIEAYFTVMKKPEARRRLTV